MEQSTTITDMEQSTIYAEILNTFTNNSFWQYLLLVFFIIVGYTIGKLVGASLIGASKKVDDEKRLIINEILVSLGNSISIFGLAIGVSFGVNSLNFSPNVKELVETLVAIFIIFSIGYIFYHLANVPHLWLKRRAEDTENSFDDMLAPILRTCLRVAIVIIVIVQVAEEISGKPVTSIIAGLGIGGIAIALAAQDTLKNFLGSVMIFFDKPFQIGERVVVDGFDGPVELVGLRSTKIRTLEGHLVTIPNGELANKNIRNISKRPHIRRIMNVSITYGTTPDKIQQALDIAKSILENHEGMDEEFPPRVYFNDMGSTALNLFVIYWYHPPDYWGFMKHAEWVNMEFIKKFNEAGIEFAFPTQTIHIADSSKNPIEEGRLGTI